MQRAKIGNGIIQYGGVRHKSWHAKSQLARVNLEATGGLWGARCALGDNLSRSGDSI